MSLVAGSETIRLVESGLNNTIRGKYQDKNPLLVCVMDGGFMFAADMVRLLPHQWELKFIKVKSYGNSQTPEHEPVIMRVSEIDHQDRHVLFLDDVWDTGETGQALKAHALKKGALSAKVCTLCYKETPRTEGKPDIYGLKLDDYFLVGYGMDYEGGYRGLPDIVSKDSICNTK